jgi:hypothetical protein
MLSSPPLIITPPRPRLIVPANSRRLEKPRPVVPDSHQMRRVRIDKMTVKDAVLARMLELWRISTDYQDFADIAVHELRGFAHLVDTTPEDPDLYAFRLFGSAVSLFNYGNMTNMPIVRLPLHNLDFREDCLRQYHEAATSGDPQFHKVRLVSASFARRSDAKDFDRTYTRLLLPMTHRDQRRLLVLINHRPIAGL